MIRHKTKNALHSSDTTSTRFNICYNHTCKHSRTTCGYNLISYTHRSHKTNGKNRKVTADDALCLCKNM